MGIRYQINISKWEMGIKWLYQDGKCVSNKYIKMEMGIKWINQDGKWVSSKYIKMGNGYQINTSRWEMGVK